MTFERQKLTISCELLSVVRNILNSLPKDKVFILMARNQENILVSGTVVLIDKKSAYSLLTVNHPDHRKLGANTALVVEAMLHSKRLGIQTFDFVGANSPERADYKISFNADLKCYFEVQFKSK